MVKRVPLAQQVADEVRALVGEVGEFRPGDRLPGERQLAARFGVSYGTVREALAILGHEGVLVRKWGVGTIVRDVRTPAAFSLSDLVPVRDRIAAAGHKPSLEAASVTQVPAPAEVAEPLDVPRGDPVWLVDRIFGVDGMRAISMREFLPLTLGGRGLDPRVLTDLSRDLLGFLAEDMRTRIVRMETTLEAFGADGALADRLRIAPGTPVVRALQASYSDADKIVVVSWMDFHTELIKLETVRTARA